MLRRPDHLPQGGQPIVRVFVVDDAAFIRKAMKRVLSADPKIRVVGEASSGAEALEKIPRVKPDLVTLDVDMPGMDGLTTLRQLMKIVPGLPVVMLSSMTREGADTTLDALATGAVDFLDKTRLNVMDFGRLSEELLNKIKVWGQNGREPARTAPRRQAPRRRKGPDAGGEHRRGIRPVTRRRARSSLSVDWTSYDVCVVGASTGGPVALEALLKGIPEGFPLPMAIVQHMPPGFTRPFAERLDALSTLHVREAGDGDRLEPGLALIAPAGRHLLLRRSGKVRLSQEPETVRHRPSVDVMMETAARAMGGRVVGVLFTGMGEDGAEGMCRIHDGHGLTIAENEETCVVPGMPKAAFLRGGVSHYLPLYEIVRLFYSLS